MGQLYEDGFPLRTLKRHFEKHYMGFHEQLYPVYLENGDQSFGKNVYGIFHSKQTSGVACNLIAFDYNTKRRRLVDEDG